MIDQELLAQYFPETASLLPTSGGHMAYDYALLDHDGSRYFVKHHDPRNFTDSKKEEHSRYYLQKENDTFNHLRELGFTHIPAHNILLDRRALVLEGLSEKDGWYWRAPQGPLFKDYIDDCLQALRTLEEVRTPLSASLITPTYTSFIEEGWDRLRQEDNIAAVRQKITSFYSRLRPENHRPAQELTDDIKRLAEIVDSSYSLDVPLAHHDARQANVAWHPSHGAKLVDWSWAGPGPRGSDTTSFLIDLAKSGFDISDYKKWHFNNDHAHVLIGFWLGHSLWPTRASNDSVRFHQVASAVTAYRLLTDD